MRHSLLLISFLSLFLFVSDTTAQTFEWAKQMGGTVRGEGHSIAVDAYGNIYTTGAFGGTVDFDPGPGTFNLTSAGNDDFDDIFISKVDASGNFLWAKRIGGENFERSKSIAVDSYGNVLITGDFLGTVDFDPGPGTFNLSTWGYSLDAFICKFDSSGNFIWAKRMGGVGSSYGISIKLDAFGNIYTTGAFSGTADFDPGTGVYNLASLYNSHDIFISKLDSSGNFLWVKRIGGSGDDFGLSIAVDSYGNVYTTGYFEDTVDFDPGPGNFNLISLFREDVFISKLDASGNFVWARKIGGKFFDIGFSIALDAFGNVFTTGKFSETVDFDPDTGIYNLTSTFGSVFVSKLDSSGNFVWARNMGGKFDGYGYSIAVDTSGSVYTTGVFNDTADFDPGPDTFNLISTSTSEDIFISKLNDSGDFVWAKKIGGVGVKSSYSITLDVLGNVYTTGFFENKVDFDKDHGTFSLTSIGDRDIFVSKLSQCTNSSIDSFTVCNPYTWIDNITYTSSTNTPTFTLSNTLGCDSVVTLDLTINSKDTSITKSNDSLIVNQSGAEYQWLNCDSSYKVVNGATNKVFSPSKNGFYACELSLNGCVDTTACIQVIVTGIEENNLLNNFKLYPNPFANQLTIETDVDGLNTTITILNIKGQLVYESTTNLKAKTVLNTADWAKGMYFIRLSSEQGVGTIKLVH